MKRHPAFQDLSRDHFVALNRCLQVVRAVDGHPAARPFEVARSQLADLWQHDGLEAHFAEEEADLVPVLRGRGGAGPDLAERMLGEHGDLRSRLGAIREAGPAEAKATADQLTRHARWEEAVVFGWLQANLSEAELQELLARSQAFRSANGMPVNPPRP